MRNVGGMELFDGKHHRVGKYAPIVLHVSYSWSSLHVCSIVF